MNYTRELVELDVKRGHVHTVADWHRIGEKAQHTPADLTDDDLIVLEGFGGPSSAAAARARREQALAPALPPDQPTAAPATTKATAPTLTRKTISDYFLKYSDAIFPIIGKKFTQQQARIDALEQRITQLEARPLQKWAGVHVDGAPYAEASLVTKSGSLWVATTATTSTPGEPGGDWRLIVKKGHA